jgi:hypothetical protein
MGRDNGWTKDPAYCYTRHFKRHEIHQRSLNAEAVPFMQRDGPVVFQQEDARPHTTKITRARLTSANVNTMQWPAISPDMNPIEHIWDVLGRNVR